MLFALEANASGVEPAIDHFWRESPGDAEGRAYADELVRRVTADQAEADELIRAASTNWRLERMMRVDRCVLRLGAWELAHRPDIPRPVIIDEAVSLAKRYGNENSSAFVNGVLDKIADDCGRGAEALEPEPDAKG